MPVQSLPWLPSSEQFLRAIIAGSELGESRARREAQERDARESRRPRFVGGGGGGFRPLAIPSPIQSTTDPIQPPPMPAPQPFDVAGQKFITNPISQQVEPYFPPTSIEKVGDNLVQLTKEPGVGTSPGAVSVKPLYEGSKPIPRVTLTTPDTTGLTPRQKSFALAENPPRLSGSPSEISNYLAQSVSQSPKGPALPLPKTRAELKTNQLYRTVRGEAVWDGDSFELVR